MQNICLMELRHLRYFLAIAEEGNVTRAAARLGIQQPPLSQQMRDLERELGTRLFEREARGIALTDAGRVLAADAHAILNLVQRAADTVRKTASGERGDLGIGFTSSTPFHPFLPRLIRMFGDDAPAVKVKLEENGTAELVAALRDERLDIAFVRSPVSAADLVVDNVLSEEMIVALPAGHLLARGRQARNAINIQELENVQFILYRRPSGPGLHDTIIAACHHAGFSPRVAQEAPVIVSTLNLVAAGLGVSIVPASLRRQRMEGIIYRRIADRPAPSAPINAVYRRRLNSGALRRFVDLLGPRHEGNVTGIT